MAKTTAATPAAPAFDIDAYLASTSKSSGGITNWIFDKVEGAVAAASDRVGQMTATADGVAEIYDLGKKVGAIRGARRVEEYRERARAEIQRLLAR